MTAKEDRSDKSASKETDILRSKVLKGQYWIR